MKPENLPVDRNGMVKIADFGIARMMDESAAEGIYQTGARLSAAHAMTVGTPDYAAPEQRACGPSDHRADIYSLGVVLYEMITGERPGNGAITPPSRRAPVDMGIDEVVLKALQEEPELCFRTVAEFREQFEEAKRQMKRKPLDEHPRRWWRSKRGLVAMISVGSLVLTVAVIKRSSIHMGDSLVPEIAGEPMVEMRSQEEAYQAFEENFSALQEARKIQVVGMPDDSDAPATQADMVKNLEARDRQLRAMIVRMTKGEN